MDERTPPALALLTDFGLRDAYVGVMKGVIHAIAPRATVIDLSHEVPPQDERGGAFLLWSALPYFAPGTVFCCVVDPGVGGSRRAVAVRGTLPGGPPGASQPRELRFVAPDNGLLTAALDELDDLAAVTLDAPAYQLPTPSRTFHGRDLFAPAAAHLAAGVPLAELGEPLAPEALVRRPLPRPERRADAWHGEVIHIDRFGNLVTSLRGADLDGRRWLLRVAGVTVEGLHDTFASVPERSPVAYVGSSDRVELALRNTSAAAAWRVARGAPVTAVPADEA